MNRNFNRRIQSQDKSNVMGIDEYLKEIAKEEQARLFVGNLLKEGFPLEKIASLANVTVDFVKEVKKSQRRVLQLTKH